MAMQPVYVCTHNRNSNQCMSVLNKIAVQPVYVCTHNQMETAMHPVYVYPLTLCRGFLLDLWSKSMKSMCPHVSSALPREWGQTWIHRAFGSGKSCVCVCVCVVARDRGSRGKAHYCSGLGGTIRCVSICDSELMLSSLLFHIISYRW